MAILKIPLDSESSNFDFQIDLDGVTYTLSFEFNSRAAQWQMAIYDLSGENLILGSIPVLINYPLLHSFNKTGDIPPGEFIAIDETGQNKNPTGDNLGIDIQLYYVEAVS